MTKLLSPILSELIGGIVAFNCPGCGETHQVSVEGPNAWGYNQNPAAPTFTPSILVRSGHYVPGWRAETCYCKPDKNGEDWGFKCYLCHSFVADGRIQFLSDCSHALAGQTVDLPNYPVNNEGDVE